ncbi:MAG: hypothetical protein AB1649_11685 [Chloroflexota bacterium]
MKAKTLPHGHIALPYDIYRRLGLENGAWIDVEFDQKTGCITLRPVYRKYSFVRTSWKQPNGRLSTKAKKPTK